MTREELHRAEKDAFLAWRRGVARAELEHGGGVVAEGGTGTHDFRCSAFHHYVTACSRSARDTV
jgi:hypothetical protein